MALPIPLLLLGGAALVFGKKKKRRVTASGESQTTPWFLQVYYDQVSDSQWKADNRCKNKEAYLNAVLPALKDRLDQFRDAAAAANFVGFNESDEAGDIYKSDLRMIDENLFEVHCG